MGRNIGYGGAGPRVPGAVVIDLGKRMSKILDIDGDNASCIVEPGVSYFALYEEIQRRNLPLWIDCPDLGGGSVLGNAIDRGVGYADSPLFLAWLFDRLIDMVDTLRMGTTLRITAAWNSYCQQARS